MNVKPDFEKMTQIELRAYVLAHRNEDEALSAYLDKRRIENQPSRTYGANDDVSAAIDEFLQRNSKH